MNSQEFRESISGPVRYGLRVAAAREAAGLTQAELANRCGAPTSHIVEIEEIDHSNGYHIDFLETLNAIPRSLPVNKRWLCQGKGPPVYSMPELIVCQSCSAQISKTALNCPKCGNRGQGQRNAIMDALWEVGAGTILLVVAGPVGAAVSITSVLSDKILGNDTFSIKDAVKAGRQFAFDQFSLGGSTLCLVDHENFLIYNMRAGTAIMIDRPDMLGADADPNHPKSKRIFGKPGCLLTVRYTDSEGNASSENYLFRGENSRILAKFAAEKFQEYSVTEQDSLGN